MEPRGAEAGGDGKGRHQGWETGRVELSTGRDGEGGAPQASGRDHGRLGAPRSRRPASRSSVLLDPTSAHLRPQGVKSVESRPGLRVGVRVSRRSGTHSAWGHSRPGNGRPGLVTVVTRRPRRLDGPRGVEARGAVARLRRLSPSRVGPRHLPSPGSVCGTLRPVDVAPHAGDGTRPGPRPPTGLRNSLVSSRYASVGGATTSRGSPSSRNGCFTRGRGLEDPWAQEVRETPTRLSSHSVRSAREPQTPAPLSPR